MADKQENSNGKQYYEDSFKQQQNHQAPANDVPEVKSITNIYYDCLERIFDFLDLRSLLMVANTCKRLQIAAAAKFSDEYGKTEYGVTICPYPANDFGPANDFEFYSYEGNLITITVNGLETCLSFLRCFGSKISELFVEQSRRSGNKCVDQYVNKYCADTVADIGFRFAGQGGFLFSKLFKNVEDLSVGDVVLPNELTDIVKWFPKLRSLRMRNYSSNGCSFGVRFPQLKELTLDFDDEFFDSRTLTFTKGRLTTENTLNFLRANPQISSLNICSGLTMTTVLDMISGNPSILTLHLFRTKCIMDEIERFTREHRFVVDLWLYFHEFTSEEVIYIIRNLDSLKNISIKMKNRSECERLLSQKDNEWEIESLNELYYNLAYTGHIFVSLKR